MATATASVSVGAAVVPESLAAVAREASTTPEEIGTIPVPKLRKLAPRWLHHRCTVSKPVFLQHGFREALRIKTHTDLNTENDTHW